MDFLFAVGSALVLTLRPENKPPEEGAPELWLPNILRMRTVLLSTDNEVFN